jgi:hypothetical protein
MPGWGGEGWHSRLHVVRSALPDVDLVWTDGCPPPTPPQYADCIFFS